MSNNLIELGELIALNEVLQIVFLILLSGISVFFVVFLFRQRSQLIKLQEQLAQESVSQEEEVKADEPLPEQGQQDRMPERLTHDEFSENLGIIKDLQSKLDGMAIELKIRGEMIIERDNKIGKLEKVLSDLEAQIEIFKQQIAPALERTITDLSNEKEELQKRIEELNLEVMDKVDRINASKNILKKAGMGQLLELEEYQVQLDRKEILMSEQVEIINTLQEQVDQLPVICLRMTEEIKSREADIHSLEVYNKVLNKKLITLQQELNQNSNDSETSIRDLSKKIIELTDLLNDEKNKSRVLDEEIHQLQGIILDKEVKVSKLEEKLQNLMFK